MAQRRTLTLTPAERHALERMRTTDPKPYRRQRALALLRIADGHTPHWVALHGLGHPVSPDQVYTWLSRYQAEGRAGLTIRPGRGRKPACFRLELA
jgi:hypothetical protein